MKCMLKMLVVMAVIGLLTACTMTHTPEPYLPSREGIVAGETITVQGNQNVYTIARQNNVAMREIIVLNDLHPPFALKSGEKLILPAKAGGAVPISGNTLPPGAAPPASQTAVEQQELPPVQPAPAKDQNNQKAAGAAIIAAPVEALNTPSAPAKPVSTTLSGQAAVVSSAPASEAAEAAAPAAIKMVWPVQGPILSKFGAKGQGLNNDGVNIGAPKGAPVVASAGGIVVYAGDEMKGFGNLVLIRHQDGWVTAYAHLDRVLVNKDAVVAQGDMIGTVGKTGNVPSPQLHFETRFKDKPVDPSTVIKS